jgi:two-component system sensor histidine kinase KdpD
MPDLMAKILEMARQEAGEVVLNLQWNAPEEIVGSALRKLDKKLKLRQVNVHMADNLALIHVDAVLLQQVMVNLLDNADKYSPAGLPSTFRLKPHRSVYTTCKQIVSKNAVLQHSG